MPGPTLPGTGPSVVQPPFDFFVRSSRISPTIPSIVPSFVTGDRVQDTALSITSTTVNLNNSPPQGFRSFQDGIGHQNYCLYVISDGVFEEISYGQYNNLNWSLSRSAIPLSTNGTPGQQIPSWGPNVNVFNSFPSGSAMAMLWGGTIGLSVGDTYGPVCARAGGSTANFLPGQILYTPVLITQPFNSFNVGWTSAGVTATGVLGALGLYTNRGARPYQLIGQQTGVNLGNPLGGNTNYQTSTISCAFPCTPGLYWACVNNQTPGSINLNVGSYSASGQSLGSAPVPTLFSPSAASNLSASASDGWFELSYVLSPIASPSPTVSNSAFPSLLVTAFL